MPFVLYTATESIAPGHVRNVQYSLAFKLQSADPSDEILKSEQRSLSGVKETLHFGKTRRWSLVMEPFGVELLPYYEEFFDSTADGQTFVLDPYGSELAPRRSMSVTREDKGATYQRLIITGDPVNSDVFRCGFEVSEVS